jgi:hypothetical protein
MASDPEDHDFNPIQSVQGALIRGVKLSTDRYVVPKLGMRGFLPLSPHVFMAWYLIKHRDNFTLLYFTLPISVNEFFPNVCFNIVLMFLLIYNPNNIP